MYLLLYSETSEKMIEISKNFKEVIIKSHPEPLERVSEKLNAIQYQVEEFDLLFRK